VKKKYQHCNTFCYPNRLAFLSGGACAEPETKKKMGNLPKYEIAEVILLDQLPDKLTYPLIQPILFESVIKSINSRKL
jgi:hypothetical protein